MTSLYLHIPFCHKKCLYCSFVKEVWRLDKEAQFVEAICQEMSCYREKFGAVPVDTVFVGGGTPSSLRPASLSRIFHHMHACFEVSSQSEKTCEMNPESVTSKHLDCLKSTGFNRVSMGVQSFDAQELRTLGRNHGALHVQKAVALLQEKGFFNFNLDIMFGLPHTTLATLERTLVQAISLHPTHLSTYALTIERGTPFSRNHQQKVPEDTELAHYHFIQRFLHSNGYIHYEVSAFSKPGFQCRHNVGYWHLDPFIGLGPSGASFFQNYHYVQTKNIDQYLQDPRPVFLKKKIQGLSKSTQIKDYVVANLRRIDGICLTHFYDRFQQSFVSLFSQQIQELVASGHLKQTPARISVSSKGLDILDTILIQFC